MKTITVTQTYCETVTYKQAELVSETDEKFILRQGIHKIEIHYPKPTFSYEVLEEESSPRDYPDYERSFLTEDKNEEDHSCESIEDSSEHKE